MRTKKWLTFDLDGTLMQNPFTGWVFPEIVSLIKQYTSEDVDIKKMIVTEHRKRMRDSRTLEAYDWDDIVKKVLVDLNISMKINVEELVIKHAVVPKVYLLEADVLDQLRKLRWAGYSLAAVTNGYYIYQHPVMKELGLDQLFDKIIAPDVCGYAKPNEHIMDIIMGDGEIVGHVGDRIDHDIVLANRLDIHSIWFNKHLPESIVGIPVDKRHIQPKVSMLYKEKWKNENDGRNVPFTNDCTPDIVINAIGELVDDWV